MPGFMEMHMFTIMPMFVITHISARKHGFMEMLKLKMKHLGYGLCWKEKELHLIYACSEQDFIEEIKQIKACDCDFCEWQDVQRKAERFKRGYSCGIPVPEEHIKQVEMIDRDMDYYLMRMEDGWCCGAEGEHIVEGKNQQDIIKSMSNIKVCHCSKCRHWLSRWVDLSWKIGKAD